MHIGKANGLAKKVPSVIQRGSLRTNQTTLKETIVLEWEKIIYIYSLKGNLRKQVEQDYEAGGTDGKMEQTDGKTLFLKKKKIYL